MSFTWPTLVVTRPQPQADAWVERLVALGCPAVALPLLVIEPQAAFVPAVSQAWLSLAEHRLVMFVSPNAALQFFAQAPSGQRWPMTTWAAATGPGTVAALREQGLDAAQILSPSPDADQFDAETLWQQRLADRDWRGQKVLIVRGEDGRDWLASTLREAGAQVDLLAAYRRVGPAWDATSLSLLSRIEAAPAQHAWQFSSSEAVRHLAAWIAAQPMPHPGLLQAPALATHPRIAETARACGWTRVLDVTPDASQMLACLRAWVEGPRASSPA
ncbi:uroporphyrinogen-III synthase [Sphaerotilus mobilis]|uniref:Uroporphyrinogen-III synthase n=1 Tax=Sphaerotilus mobilis TaxID=47994 RepID=A0A4Q7LDH3_9BURK|nr:uroporphyrinogen-III synthase [Sphaerotilus mobilis]RZS52042.1 uroporphyrinogen-III synthase [Sphaerotilus mobilis]